MRAILILTLLTQFAYAYDFGDLKESDQKYFKNEHGQGSNQLERIDKNVKELNRMWGEINQLKSKIKKLENEITELKGSK